MTAGEVVRILLDEQVHHGAEIALLRDLYPRRRGSPPLSCARVHSAEMTRSGVALREVHTGKKLDQSGIWWAETDQNDDSDNDDPQR
jgi:hypothetical protein